MPRFKIAFKITTKTVPTAIKIADLISEIIKKYKPEDMGLFLIDADYREKTTKKRKKK